MKFYPCILIDKDELEQTDFADIWFQDGRLTDTSFIQKIEDYCGRPVVSVRQSTRNDGGIIVLAADGYIQYNPISKLRTTVLIGQYDNLKVILSDIFDERPDEDPFDIFCSYAYQTDINAQLDLKNWVRDEYHRTEK